MTDANDIDAAAVRKVLVEFIVNEVSPHIAADSLTDEVNLIEESVLDSLGIFSLVGLIQERYDIEIDIEDLTPENFETIPSIVGLVSTTVRNAAGG